MYLDYSKIKSGRVERPVLLLQTLAGKSIGTVPLAYNIKFDIRYADVSEISFDVPYMNDGKINPYYDATTSYKMIYTKNLGIYVLASPQKNGDGVKEIKTVHGYSLEKLFERKRLYLEEGTYDFWNPAHPSDTILGRIIETDTTWSVGYVDPKLIGCYRTFDEYDSDPLTFCYNNAAEKYQCAVVFDVYNKTINAYDASKSRGTLPIYLSYENLVSTAGVTELTDDIVTKLRVYGADGFTIRDVNPTGADYLIDLSWFIHNGDLDIKIENSTETLAERVTAWQAQIKNRQQYYTGLIAARSSKTAQRIAADVDLTTLNGELETLTIQQSVTVQALALETTDSGKAAQQASLTTINGRITAKQREITAKEAEISALQSEIDEYASNIRSINDELAFTKYFTEEEQKVLNHYLIENGVTEETFVATDVDISVSGVTSTISGSVNVSGAEIERVNLSGKQMHTIAGGVLTVADANISADIVRGTLEVNTGSNDYVLTAYLGTTTYGDHSFPSGMITISGKYTQFSSDVSAQYSGELLEYKGSQFTLNVSTSNVFFTVNVNDYQKYSVAQELYEYGAEVLDEYAWPVYEFQIESGNFLFVKEFEPFKDKLELGKAVHLSLGSDGNITANIIGVTLNFDNPADFTLTFSNQFQMKDGTERWRKDIAQAGASSRSFDASKYIYNRTANKTAQVSQFMEGQLNAAVNTIIGAQNQSVVINGAGMLVGGESPFQIRIVDSMIAMSDDSFKTAKIGIGRFASPETGIVWGVNAEMLAGKAMITNKFIMEDVTDDGTMMFKLDQTGAWLYNSRMVLQGQKGGLMIFDPKYGIVAGDKLLFDTNGTTVTPEFIDSRGDIAYDSDGMPKNANFFLDINTGDAYFRGKVLAKSGQIGGFTIEESYLHTGSGKSYVALNGSTSNNQSLYALWAGATAPGSAPFWVKKDGTMYAKGATFGGVTNLSGNIQYQKDTGNDDEGWLIGCGINVNNGNFYVDKNGNVTMKGSINLTGSITWSSTNTPVQYQFSSNGYSWHNTMYSTDYYRRDSLDGGKTWGGAYQFRGTDGANGRDGVDGSDASVTRANIYRAMLSAYSSDGLYSYNGALLINASAIKTGTIDAGSVYLADRYGGFCRATGSDGMNTTYGAKMYGSNGEYGDEYVFVSNKGARMGAGGNYLWIGAGGLHSSVELSVDSDRKFKNEIEHDAARYETFFSALRPATFLLDREKDGKRHLGFVAQEVEEAMQTAGLTYNDLALLDIFDQENAEKVMEKTYGIRYGEFIALSVHMIQMLMQRVEKLETAQK